jgi:methylenetetrahydrofolate--tRNA-(uracil-5-)-methyltransferase
VQVVGGGLAGCEAAWQLARRGVPVRLFEMRPVRSSPAHSTDALGELVCSNSLRSDAPENAVGLLHEELRRAGSLVLSAADANRVPAGSALAVERAFSGDQRADRGRAGDQLVRAEVPRLPEASRSSPPARSPATRSAAIAELCGDSRSTSRLDRARRHAIA